MSQTEDQAKLPDKLSLHTLSSNIIRRKIHSSLGLRPPKISPTRCKSVLNLKNPTFKAKCKTSSKSPLRSRSQKDFVTDKENCYKRKSPSPSRPEGKTHRASKSYFKADRNLKTSMGNLCGFGPRDPKALVVKHLNEVIKKPSLKQKATLLPKGKNLKTSKTGAKVRAEAKSKKVKTEEKTRAADGKEVKHAGKSELSRKKEAKCVDLGKVEIKKAKIKSKRKKEEKKTHRSKKSALKTFDLTHNVDDMLASHEIFKTLDHFERKKKLLKTGKTKVQDIETHRNLTVVNKTKSKTPQRVKKKRIKRLEVPAKAATAGLGVDSLSKQSEAAGRIQRWYRRIVKKRKETPTACPDFDESLVIKSAHRRTATLTRHKPSDSIFTLLQSELGQHDKLQSSLTLLSSGSFQLKRPRDLDIEAINTPLLTCALDSVPSLSSLSSPSPPRSPAGPSLPSSGSRFVPGRSASPPNEEVKHSFQSDSLEQSIKASGGASAPNPQNPCKPCKQPSRSTQALQQLQQLPCYLSEEDSLQSDIEISSSLIRQFEELTSESQKHSQVSEVSEVSQVSEVSDLDDKIPISTPEFSINLVEIISEVVEAEVGLFSSSIRFLNNELCVDPSAAFMTSFLKEIFNELKKTEDEVLDIVNTPAFVDPLDKLRTLQCSNIGELRKYRELDEMIPQEICEFMQERFRGEQVWVRKVYLQMLFDCVNECFNLIRPFGRQGLPDPWVHHSRLLFGEGELKRVYRRTCGLMASWMQLKAGTQPPGLQSVDSAKLQVVREESMSKLLCFDVNNEEMDWVEYGDEETQSKNDLADVILFDLFTEVIFVLK